MFASKLAPTERVPAIRLSTRISPRFRDEPKISYEVPTTALSLLVVPATSLLGMLPLATPRLRLNHFVSSTLAIVIGLTAMQDLGVAAMRSEATIYYEPAHFLLSVAIALGSSLATVPLFTFFRRHDAASTLLKLPAGSA
ncbi:MHYT domain-containing protein [Metapseudomonas boanensis]|uniref:MHYT domain-containing protein n=2 Tax=Metapseudomonas boanensis TaxID=2822138 RepID=A0ABS5XAG2_9GAMM|nr:hypothetical protein [Pseudomonas boanensis]